MRHTADALNYQAFRNVAPRETEALLRMLDRAHVRAVKHTDRRARVQAREQAEGKYESLAHLVKRGELWRLNTPDAIMLYLQRAGVPQHARAIIDAITRGEPRIPRGNYYGTGPVDRRVWTELSALTTRGYLVRLDRGIYTLAARNGQGKH